MKKLPFILGALYILFLASCQDSVNESQSKEVVNESDYKPFITLKNNPKLDLLNEDIQFWKEKNNADTSFVFQTALAGLYGKKFDLTGNPIFLNKADSLYALAVEATNYQQVGILQGMAAHAITQHQFNKSYDLAQQALQIKDNQYGSHLLVFDASMELGYYPQAEAVMNNLEDKNSINYMVRYAKWLDYIGNLDSALVMMEKAIDKVEPTNQDLQIWLHTNLGDMYGHQGRINDSYNQYLKVLAMDSFNYYSLKGIAYIAFAHDENYEMAHEILDYLIQNHPVPDYYLMKADIAAMQEDEALKSEMINQYIAQINNPAYGVMYRSHKSQILAEEQQNYSEALALAEAEVAHRSTPETYDLLAWTHYLNGNESEAVEIAKQHVEGKTFEPNAGYHLGVIYQNEYPELSKKYLSETVEASFELGPSVAMDAKRLLNAM